MIKLQNFFKTGIIMLQHVIGSKLACYYINYIFYTELSLENVQFESFSKLQIQVKSGFNKRVFHHTIHGSLIRSKFSGRLTGIRVPLERPKNRVHKTCLENLNNFARKHKLRQRQLKEYLANRVSGYISKDKVGYITYQANA